MAAQEESSLLAEWVDAVSMRATRTRREMIMSFGRKMWMDW